MAPLRLLLRAAGVLLLAAAARADWWSWLGGVASAVSSLGSSLLPRPAHPLSLLTTPQLVRQFGRPAEVHRVTTADGYVLELHRLSPRDDDDDAGGGPPVLVNHGVLCSSADWILAGPGKALGFVLSDAGYDVWLGNFRGNRYSNKHVNLTTEYLEYWDFSFHEMGLHDVPAEIDYVLNATGRSKVLYVGFSMGAAAFLVMASERPEYNDKVSAMVGLAPAAYMSHTRGPFYRMASMTQNVLQLGNMFGWGEFMTSHALLAQWGQQNCEANPVYEGLCSHAAFLITGYNSPQFNKTLLPIVLGHIPAGASTKTMMHFVQGISSGKFRQFDDSVLPPMLSMWEPPEYNLSRLTVPAFLLYGSEDWIVNSTDAQQTFGELNGTAVKQELLLDGFNHMDFLFAINASSLVYSRVVDFLKNHTEPPRTAAAE